MDVSRTMPVSSRTPLLILSPPGACARMLMTRDGVRCEVMLDGS